MQKYFPWKVLEKTWKEAELPSEREHVTTFMKKNKEIFKLYNLENESENSNIQISNG